MFFNALVVVSSMLLGATTFWPDAAGKKAGQDFTQLFKGEPSLQEILLL